MIESPRAEERRSGPETIRLPNSALVGQLEAKAGRLQGLARALRISAHVAERVYKSDFAACGRPLGRKPLPATPETGNAHLALIDDRSIKTHRPIFGPASVSRDREACRKRGARSAARSLMGSCRADETGYRTPFSGDVPLPVLLLEAGRV